MKTRTKITAAASATILLVGLGVASVTQAHGKKGEHGGGSSYGMGQGQGYHGMGQGMGQGRHGMDQGRYGMGKHGARGMTRMLGKFDGNGDGDVTQAEIDEARATRLARFDTDGDGNVSLKEYESLWLAAMRERMVDRFQYLDADGDGMVNKAEFVEPYSGMVKFTDRNGDGMLNRDDMGRYNGRMMRDDDDDDDDS